MSEPLAKKEAGDLKRAIEAGNFEQAPVLAEAYGAAVRKAAEAARSSRERAAILEEGRAFLEDRLNLTRVLRAHLGTQYRATAGVALYQNFGSTHSSWQMEG